MNGFFIHLYVHWENLKLCSKDARKTVWCLTQHWPLCMGENQAEEQRTSWQAQKKNYALEIMVIKFTDISK